MQPIIMQDWITIRGTTTSTVVIMSQADWILTAPFQDIVFYMDVREVSGTVAMHYQTCPARDDVLFQNLGAVGGVAVAAGLTVTSFPLANATVPVSHWTRWRLTASVGTPWDMTFRIMAAANSIG